MNKLNLGVNEAKKIKNAVGWDKKKRKKEEKEPYSLGMGFFVQQNSPPIRYITRRQMALTLGRGSLFFFFFFSINFYFYFSHPPYIHVQLHHSTLCKLNYILLAQKSKMKSDFSYSTVAIM